MKKLLLSGAILFSFVLLAQGVVFQVSAQGELEDLPTGPESFEDVLKIIDTITNWVFAGLMAVSVIMIMLAGFQFIMEGKDPAKVTEAKNKVLFAIGGIAIALVAKAIEPALRSLLGLQ